MSGLNGAKPCADGAKKYNAAAATLERAGAIVKRFAAIASLR